MTRKTFFFDETKKKKIVCYRFYTRCLVEQRKQPPSRQIDKDSVTIASRAN